MNGPSAGYRGDRLMRVSLLGGTETDDGLPMAEPAPLPHKRSIGLRAVAPEPTHDRDGGSGGSGTRRRKPATK